MPFDFKYTPKQSKVIKLASDFVWFFNYINGLRRLPEYKNNPQFKEILKQSKKFRKYESMFFKNDLLSARPCRVCGRETIVYDTRVGRSGEIIRRRKCLNCGSKHRTVELYDGEVGSL